MHQQMKEESKLVRASTLPSEYIRANIDLINTALNLMMDDDLSAISENWSEQERQKGRRLVRIKIESKSLPQFKVRAEAVKPGNFSSKDVVISCIRWPEKNIDVVTSVDIITVIEHFVGQTLSVEEKSRIRRNLQFLKPYTITKSGAESKRLFHSIMAMENPKPRNIEKNLKVFKWTDLFLAVTKVLSKYSPSPNSSIKPTIKPCTIANHESSEVTKTEVPLPVSQYPLRGSNRDFSISKNRQEGSAVTCPSANQFAVEWIGEWNRCTTKGFRGMCGISEAGNFPRRIQCI